MRYFFNIRRGDTLVADPDGTELESLDAVRTEASDAAREILAARLRNGDVVDGDVFEITDEAGTIVEQVPLRTVLRLE
jgi:hypothetical protein